MVVEMMIEALWGMLACTILGLLAGAALTFEWMEARSEEDEQEIEE